MGIGITRMGHERIIQQLATWDERWSRRLQPPADSVLHKLAVLGAHVGDGVLWLLFWLLLMGCSYHGGEMTLFYGAVAWIAAAILGALITYSIKFWLKRRRPQEIAGFYSHKYDAHAFPSGHATRMGTVAIFGFFLFAGWGWFFLAVSLWVIWSRASLGIHYIGDVTVGYSIGLFASAIVLWLR